MPLTSGHYSEGPEALIVNLAMKGDREAFAELVRRRQGWIRSLMRRCSGEPVLADDLSQQVFMQAWRKIRQLKDATRFGPWIKRLAINEWLQYARKNDVLNESEPEDKITSSKNESTTVAMDLDHALSTLPGAVRLCIVLAYHEQLSHPEISQLTKIPMGTVKSHIRRGSERLRKLLSAYSGVNSESPS